MVSRQLGLFERVSKVQHLRDGFLRMAIETSGWVQHWYPNKRRRCHIHYMIFKAGNEAQMLGMMK